MFNSSISNIIAHCHIQWNPQSIQQTLLEHNLGPFQWDVLRSFYVMCFLQTVSFIEVLPIRGVLPHTMGTRHVSTNTHFSPKKHASLQGSLQTQYTSIVPWQSCDLAYLEIYHNGKYKHSGHHIHQVWKVLAIEGLSESTYLVSSCSQ